MQRHELRGVRDQIDGAVTLFERVHTAFLSTTPHKAIPLDQSYRGMLDSFVVKPIRQTLDRIVEAGVAGESFRNAVDNVKGYDGSSAVSRYVLALGCVRAEIDRLLHDPGPVIEATVETAFAHLQRLIVVDANVRAAWTAAHGRDEESCEKLGGVHLLAHGLWAFKADAAGERSDLVLGERLSALDSRALQASRGLILTEWKRVQASDTDAAIEKRAQAASSQLAAYGAGSLAAVELRSVRYVVLVSEKRIATRSDLVAADYRVRYMNIATNPATPSKAATAARGAS